MFSGKSLIPTVSIIVSRTLWKIPISKSNVFEWRMLILIRRYDLGELVNPTKSANPLFYLIKPSCRFKSNRHIIVYFKYFLSSSSGQKLNSWPAIIILLVSRTHGRYKFTLFRVDRLVNTRHFNTQLFDQYACSRLSIVLWLISHAVLALTQTASSTSSKTFGYLKFFYPCESYYTLLHIYYLW